MTSVFFISGQHLANQGGEDGRGGPSRKVKWEQGWNNDNDTERFVGSFVSFSTFSGLFWKGGIEIGIGEIAVSSQFETL